MGVVTMSGDTTKRPKSGGSGRNKVLYAPKNERYCVSVRLINYGSARGYVLAHSG